VLYDERWLQLKPPLCELHRTIAVVLIEAIFHHIALEPSTRELEQGVFATLERDMDDT
jgi:hypothetical protein